MTIVGATLMIFNVDATDSHVIINEAENSPLLVQKAKFALPDLEETTGATDVGYVLRSTDENPMGYIDSTVIRCFMDMSPVDFSPRYKFREVGGATTSNALYGFAIPLVGDLNGDGKPEIVALGSYSTTGVNGYVEDLYIYNGQTGEEIVRYRLPARIYPVRGGFHGSPSQIVLVDSDRDKKGEIIVCYCNNNDKAIISYEINDNTFDSQVSKNDAKKLTRKWTSDVRYDAYGSNNGSSSGNNTYDYPIPQILDIDSDGTPELVIYNKIYNAVTGKYIMKFGELNDNISSKTVNIGSSGNETPYSEYFLAFPYLYDIDNDGKYDYIAGGQIYYDIDLAAKTSKILNFSSVKDGRTAVADINGDGKPEIIVTNYTSKSTTRGDLKISVWTPNFTGGTIGQAGTPGTSELLATIEYSVYSAPGQGNHSYIYIGDIDGKKQNGKLLPEISILSGRPFLNSGTSMQGIPVHPNVGDGYITTNKTISSSSQGAIVAFTWDNNAGLSINEKLKVSFMLEHDDRSINTGFTLFDFDNDGIQDICYRDERNLRIISAKKSYVALNESDNSVIRFTSSALSFTGYEYPVIADIDGDASADMIVMGRSSGGTDNARGYIFAIEGANGDLAPAPKVWNQFMYSPLKINEDLTTPKKSLHPLDPNFAHKRTDTDTEPTYIYNNTITQTTFYSVNEDNVVKPIVRTPDAEILDLAIDMGSNTVSFKLTNTGDASLNPEIPINIYQNGTYSLALSTVVGSGGLFIGDTLSYLVNITDNLGVYTVVVGATMDSDKNILPAGKFVDCNWADNYDEVASFLAKDDAVTVIQYGTAMIDVLANDILQNECATQILTPDMIVTPGGKGVMYGAFGTLQIVNNKLLYTAPQSYPDNNVVEFKYTLICNGVERSANVYIYIIESCEFGFASCAGSPYNVCLKSTPAGIEFDWYDNADQYLGDTSPNIPNLTNDMVFYAKPDFNKVTGSGAKYSSVLFPKGKITIKALSSSTHLKARWTGDIDTNWYNPANWVQVIANGKEAPITWAPVGCVDVIIPNGAKNYPILEGAANCGTIHMGDRAMISGIHLLGYTEASVDFLPVASEKNRFVMWSAPLKDMYTGDYHFTNGANQPDWGYIFMNFFQSSNPDYVASVEKEKTFTATFGSTGTALPLGKAFNVKVMAGRNGSFSFPKSSTSYTDANGQQSGTLSRTEAKRFITDGKINTSGDLTLPVNGNNSYSLIQVVNPFMAYLNVSAFLGANSAHITGTYTLWNGDVNADFINVIAYEEDNEMRYVIDDTKMTSSSAQYIAPLQSFFVTKLNGTTNVGGLKMNASSMTTTKIAGSEESYVLRSAARGLEEKGLIRITATSGDSENSTVLLSRTGAQQEFNKAEDAEKFFNHGAPISIYTLTNAKKALAINSSENFKGEVKLGLRVKDTSSPLKLSFSGLSGFGQKVTLIDHAQNDKEIDLQKESSYVFAISNEGSKDIVELNDRFSLRFGERPTGTEDVMNNTDVSINVFDGYINISSNSIFKRVEVISMSGMKIYDNAVPSSFTQIPLTSGQVYIVKVSTTDDSPIIKKVLIK